jgi:hypothetical protein
MQGFEEGTGDWVGWAGTVRATLWANPAWVAWAGDHIREVLARDITL